MKTTRGIAREIVDDFTYELHHSITEPIQIDFTKVPSRDIVNLIDHIEAVIAVALGRPKETLKAYVPGIHKKAT